MPSYRKRDDSLDATVTAGSSSSSSAATDAEPVKPGGSSYAPEGIIDTAAASSSSADAKSASSAPATEETTSIERLIRGMPKVELHVHIEGTLMPELQIELAERNGMTSTLRYRTVEELRDAYDFDDLASFLDLYYAGCSVLRTERDFYDLTTSYLTKARGDNVRHVEIFFDPQAHTSRGVSFETVVNGIHRGLMDGETRYGVTSKLIMSFLRNLSAEDAMKTLEASVPHLDKIHAVGLDSDEVDNPPEKFRSVFDRAREEFGLLSVAHAGEEGPPSYVWGALDALGVSRIDHGVRCVEDAELVRRLVEERVPLTVCPLSNVRLRVFGDMEEHCLKEMLDLGLCVSVNSDDPAYFGGFMNDNYLETQRALGLTHSDVIQLGRNGIEASFLTEEKKEQLQLEFDRYIGSYFCCQ